MKVYYKDGNVATKNLTPGISVYGEELIAANFERLGFHILYSSSS